MKIIAIGGTLSSGKDTIAHYLEKKGFVHLSLSDELREIARERGFETGREILHNIAKEVRSNFGDDYLMRLVVEKIGDSKKENFVITSIHHPEEVKYLKKRGALLWVVDAPLELRFERAKLRKRIGDGAALEEFKIQEELELNSPEAGGQRLQEVFKLGDHFIFNDGTEEELLKKIDELLEK